MATPTLPHFRADARKALRAMGRRVVPNLISTLQRKDSRLKDAINTLSWDSPLNKKLFASRLLDQRAAAMALGEIGPPAVLAIPALIQASKEDDRMLRVEAQAALIKIRQTSIQPLVEALAETTTTNWHQVATLVGELGEEAKPAIPSLIAALQNKNCKVQIVTAMQLGNAHTESEFCIPALIASLNNTNALVRNAVLTALTQFRSTTPEMQNAIIKCLEDPDPQVRFEAIIHLQAI